MIDRWYRQGWIWVLIAFAVYLLISHFGFYYGHFGVDDMVYARMANDILTSQIDWGNHYSYRWTINGMTALSYALFGINDHSSAIPGLILSIGIGFGILMCLKDRPWYVGFAAIGLYCLFQWNVFYADKLMPDIYVSAFVFLAWYAYRQRSSRHLSLLHNASLLTLGLFLAFLSKGTVVLILPLFGYLFIRDMLQRKHIGFWKRVVGMHIIVYPSYLFILYLLTGNPVARFKAIADNSYFNDCSYSEMPISATIDRLTSGFYSLITKEYLYVFLILGIAAIIGSLYKRERISQAALTIVICLLSANVMSISFSGYNPMCLDPRHYLLFTPILAVSAIEVFSEIEQHLSKWIIICSLLLISIVFIADWMHIPIVAAVAITAKRYRRELKTKISYIVLGIVCLIPSIQYMQYSKSLGYAGFKEEFTELLDSTEEGRVFYGSHVMNNLGEYYMAFDTSTTTFRDITKSNFDRSRTTQNIMVKNWYCDWHSDLKEVTYNDWLKYENLEAVRIDSADIFLNVLSLE
jgi:hypothetical protein